MGWPPNLVFALLGAAGIFCCIPMAIPQAHLPAFCSDLGILASHGAAVPVSKPGLTRVPAVVTLRLTLVVCVALEPVPVIVSG